MSDYYSSDENESQNNYILYKNRPEWNDIDPIPQDDGDSPVVAIDYPEEFEDCFNYFRAVIKKKEMSDRALELTTTAALYNPANYTVWQFRREILKALNKDLNEELDFIQKVILKDSKNYQVWHHRKVLVEWLKDGSKEKYLTETVLAKDAKNYHAWQHRQWVIKTFNLFEGELNYVDTLLNQDLRNNSAWNQRYFVVNNSTGFTESVLSSEIDYTLNKIGQITENESSWNYLRGLLLHDKGGLSRNKKVTNFCEELYNSGNKSPFLLALIVDMCDEQIGINSTAGGDTEKNIYTLERGVQLCEDLATNVDKIREKYWLHMKDMLLKKAQIKLENEENASAMS